MKRILLIIYYFLVFIGRKNWDSRIGPRLALELARIIA